MLIRRCAILLIEPRESFEFDLDSLLTGGAGLRAERQWLALAPHLDEAVELSADEIAPLGSLSDARLDRTAADWPRSSTKR